ncbi:helix-turn-helix domain-containing protein [Candidatus Uhrbacteria bacterium]|nr:helix-turn-helix domain-containing protein [Candidatus Uhrbacteria bacterium]
MILDSVGRILREARERKGWDIHTTVRQIGLSKKSILELEEGGCEVSADIYRREFLFRYAHALGLDCAELWKQFTEEKRWCMTQPRFEFQELPDMGWLRGPRRLRVMVGTILLSAVGMYLTFSLSSAIAAPLLEVDFPLDQYQTTNREVTVRGRVSGSGANVSINDVPVVADQQGRFSFTVGLSEGLNTVTVEATRQKSQKTTVVRQVVVEANK